MCAQSDIVYCEVRYVFDTLLFWIVSEINSMEAALFRLDSIFVVKELRVCLVSVREKDSLETSFILKDQTVKAFGVVSVNNYFCQCGASYYLI